MQNAGKNWKRENEIFYGIMLIVVADLEVLQYQVVYDGQERIIDKSLYETAMQLKMLFTSIIFLFFHKIQSLLDI